MAASPPSSSLPFSIIDYGYGLSNVSLSYGTQNSFTNKITTYSNFSGSYTTDKHGNPLNYTQAMEGWLYDSTNKQGGTGGFSGSPLISNGDIQGIQVAGDMSTNNAINYGLSFTATDVAGIDAQTEAYLTAPIPAGVWLFGSGLAGLGLLGGFGRLSRFRRG